MPQQELGNTAMQTKWRLLLLLLVGISTLDGVCAQRGLAQAAGPTPALVGDWKSLGSPTGNFYYFSSNGTFNHFKMWYSDGKEPTVAIRMGDWSFVDGQLHMKIRVVIPESDVLKPGYEYVVAISMPNGDTLIMDDMTYTRTK